MIEQLWCDDGQLDAAEDAALRAIDLFPEKGEESQVRDRRRVLGLIYQSKGETGKAIPHFETSLGIAPPFGWHDQQSWIRHSLAELLFDKGRSENADPYVEHAESLVAINPHHLGRAVEP